MVLIIILPIYSLLSIEGLFSGLSQNILHFFNNLCLLMPGHGVFPLVEAPPERILDREAITQVGVYKMV